VAGCGEFGDEECMSYEQAETLLGMSEDQATFLFILAGVVVALFVAVLLGYLRR
jgi:hypothetical protein